MLIGDCTGNWQPPAQAAPSRSAKPSIKLIHRGRRAVLMVRAAATLHAMSATLKYDPALLRLRRSRPALGARGALVAMNERSPGTISVAMATADAIPPGHRAAIVLDFETIDTTSGWIALTGANLNE
jgi:hypothetical protein